MERFWTLKYLQQQGITELDATLIKDVPQRRAGARRRRCRWCSRCTGTQGLPRGARVRVQARRDRRDRARRARHRHRAPRCRAGRSRGRGRSGEDEEEVAGPIAIAVDLADSDEAAPEKRRPHEPARPQHACRSRSACRSPRMRLLLTVRFVDPEAFNRVFKDTPLEVILVNAKTNERPDKAQAIAQASLAGGGDLDKGRATSPLPPSAFTAIGDSMEDAQRQVEAMQAAADAAAGADQAAARRHAAARPAQPGQPERERRRARKSAASWSSCWPRSSAASTKRTRGPRSATSARPRAKPPTPSTSTRCAAASRSAAPRTSPSSPARSCMASSR